MIKEIYIDSMIYKNTNKFTFLAVLLALVTLVSCIDDFDSCVEQGQNDYDIPEGIRSGYAINLTVTLDRMGGNRASANVNNPLEEFENYIDPEKFRVLFFDSNDKLLFESKSRWVKKLNPSSNNSEWLVSVPVFTYGNDVYEVDENGEKIIKEWNWELIREKLTTEKFKIAILANRPELDWYPAFKDLSGVPAHWYDNSGPFWNPDSTGKVSVFDLHHCQYDPMYHGKSTENGYYDFIMKDWGKDKYEDKRPKMGATSSWVNWKSETKKPTEYDPKHTSGAGDTVRYTIRPSFEHPIPMYGIQEFQPISNWTKGTPFNLSDLIGGTDETNKPYNYRSVSLLRSVARLDLLLPKSSYPTKPKMVGLWYSNIYARCEPMNVWDPTDQIWQEDHENDCEWNDIMNYGLVSSKNTSLGGTNRNSSQKNDFQKTISWFYGEWLKKGWIFKNSENQDLTPDEIPGIHYPKIFNPCVQRNKLVICSEEGEGDANDLYNDEYWHFVVYTGERNMIDPNTLPQTSGTAYATTWMFKDEDHDKKYYFIPIADYSKSQSYARQNFGPYDDFNTGNTLPTGILSYGNDLRDNVTTRDEMPWPLLRNHIYRITVTGPSFTQLKNSYLWDFTQHPNGTTVYNLDADSNWNNPRNGRTVHLSWYAEAEDTKKGPTLSKDASTYENKATWTIDGSQFSIIKVNATSDIADGANITINGQPYRSIKTTPGIMNRLILPTGKVAKKMTLYSYINTTSPAKYTNLIDFPNNSNGITIHTLSSTKITLTNNEYKFDNSYTGSNIGTNLELKVAGGFKKGDIVTITARIGSDKDGTVDLFTASSYNSTPEVLHKFSVKNTTSPASQSFILESDYDVLFLGRNVGTAAYVSLINVKRAIETDNETDTYWSEVNDVTLDPKRMEAYNDDNGAIDIYELSFEEPLNEITFTNVGKQCCYVAFVEIEDANSKVDYWKYNKNLPDDEMKANKKYVTELQGLKFGGGGSIQIYDTKPSKIRLTGAATITFPNLKEGSTITIVGQSANPNETDRGIEPVQDYLEFVSEESSDLYNGQCIFVGINKDGSEDSGVYTFKWRVTGSGSNNFVPVQFKLINGGIDFYEFRVDVPGSSYAPRRAGESSESDIMIKSEDLHSRSIKFK